MGKKKVEKKECSLLLREQEHTNALIADRITRLETKINKRIDRIVDAIDKCKRIKGM